MCFWLIFFLFIFLLTAIAIFSNSSKLKNICFYISVFSFIITVVLRFDVGWDFESYWLAETPRTYSLSDLFHGTTGYSFFDNIELMYRLLYIFSDWCGSRQILFIISGIITYPLIFLTFHKYVQNPFVAFWGFLAFSFQWSLCFTRQATAVGLICYGYRFVKEKRFFSFLFLVLFACLFHRTAILAIIIYPIYHYSSIYRSIFISLCLLLSYPLIITLPSFSEISYFRYLNIFYNTGRIFPFIRFTVVALTIIYYLYNNNTKRLQTYKSLSILPIILAVPFLVHEHLCNRIIQYFFFYELLLLSDIFNNKKVFCLLLVFMFYTFTLAGCYLTALKGYTEEDYSSYYRCVLFTDTSKLKERSHAPPLLD